MEKCTSVKQDKISLRDFKNIEHTAAEEILRNHLSSSTPISRTTTSTGRHTSSHLSTHGIPDASERPSKFSSTTLFYKTSVSSSAIFGDRSPQPNPDRGISYILSRNNPPPPPCACLQLIHFSEHTLLPYQSPVPSASRQHTSTDRKIFYIQSPQPNPD